MSYISQPTDRLVKSPMPPMPPMPRADSQIFPADWIRTCHDQTSFLLIPVQSFMSGPCSTCVSNSIKLEVHNSRFFAGEVPKTVDWIYWSPIPESGKTTKGPGPHQSDPPVNWSLLFIIYHHHLPPTCLSMVFLWTIMEGFSTHFIRIFSGFRIMSP